MAFELIDWTFSLEDRGTHSGNYLDKLNTLITEINNQITAYNAQVAANTDSAQLKADMIVLLAAVAALRDETIALRDSAEAIALGDINGTSPDFANVKINGLDVYHPGNKPTAEDVGLNWGVLSVAQALVNGDTILFTGSVDTIYSLPATIAKGHQFYVNNVGTANIIIPATAIISITDGTVTAGENDRVVVKPGDDMQLIALSTTTLRSF